MTSIKDTTTVNARKFTAAVERATGQWFCQSGAHWTKAKQGRWKGRNICGPCKERLQAKNKSTKRNP